MSYEDAIAYMEKYQCLPICEHGNHLIDWGRELLAPPCGCSLTMRAADECPTCAGVGKVITANDRDWCPECGGAGTRQ